MSKTSTQELQQAIHRLIGDYSERPGNRKNKQEFITTALSALAHEAAGLIMVCFAREGWAKTVNFHLQEVTDIVRTRHEQSSPIVKP